LEEKFFSAQKDSSLKASGIDSLKSKITELECMKGELTSKVNELELLKTEVISQVPSSQVEMPLGSAVSGGGKRNISNKPKLVFKM
jgi:hypothetical protein